MKEISFQDCSFINCCITNYSEFNAINTTMNNEKNTISHHLEVDWF
jgi:hypothetical protein